jgi:selenium-binding protein 1
MAAPREQLAYVTNSLYGVWDDLSYPQGVGAWMAKLDTDPHAGAPS